MLPKGNWAVHPDAFGGNDLTYVIAAPCIADFSCVEVCPVNAIHPGPITPEFDDTEQLFIDPSVCIDCAACVDVCPVQAVYEQEVLPTRWKHYAQVNKDYFASPTRR